MSNFTFDKYVMVFAMTAPNDFNYEPGTYRKVCCIQLQFEELIVLFFCVSTRSSVYMMLYQMRNATWTGTRLTLQNLILIETLSVCTKKGLLSKGINLIIYITYFYNILSQQALTTFNHSKEAHCQTAMTSCQDLLTFCNDCCQGLYQAYRPIRAAS